LFEVTFSVEVEDFFLLFEFQEELAEVGSWLMAGD